ncbi:MAG: Xaa-Pro peptidase family protein [Armatimonadota bacterium]|nr:Xaa-Pro peptidase family protein [Armatimonadota bacterium]MDR5696751.1 Xaa-Pro peptidase family protein [Armatimonadota bacterium]
MRRDIDRLMAERGYDAIVVSSAQGSDSSLLYVLNGVAIGGAVYIQKRGEPGVVCHGTMERGDALKTGLRCRNYGLYNMREIFARAEGDRLRARVLFFERLFADEGVTGRVAFYGQMDQGGAYALLTAMQSQIAGLEVVGEFDGGVLMTARRTKDRSEVDAIRRTGSATQSVVGDIERMLRGAARKGGRLLNESGEPMRVGEVKRRIRSTLLEHGLEDMGTIFALGRDAGLPHSRGEDDQEIVEGSPIVFDIFPRPASGGYHFDMTRTWCVGQAPQRLRVVFQDVLDCYRAVTDALRPGMRCAELQQIACRFFERRGHPTSCSDPTTQVGYVHSIGHGLGLDVHEEPRLSDVPGNDAVLEPGCVVTIEPGLYYPDEGIGVRLEDVWYLDEGENFVNLTDYPMHLEI